jgi:hypothetical protein
MMKFAFKARIYKVGINPCVKVPRKITTQMTPLRGYIFVKGRIEQHNFTQTLVPVKGAPYRLFVNGPMLKGSGVRVGDTVHFTVEQDTNQSSTKVTIPRYFKDRLDKSGVWEAFRNLTPSRQKEILKYLSFLKTSESRERNMVKVIGQLQKT